MGVGQCLVRTWSGYPTFYVRGIKPTPKGDLIQEQVKTILKNLDSNSDDQISVDETIAFFRSSKSNVNQEMRGYAHEHRDLFFTFKAEDTVAYSDLNDDMVVSRQELWESLVQWNVVRVRIDEGLKIVNRADRKGLEAFERSLDPLRRAPVEIPK